MTFKRHTVTAALPYANGPIHIGHLAGCYLPADIYVRYLRSKNEDVKFICGSDEHGVPITIKAKKEGITPQQVVDKYHKMMGDAFKEFGISFDIYSRTSSKTHHETASEFFKTLYDKGVFKEEITEQYFDVKANQFLADRYIVGTCPICGNDNAYGDQCEKCGSTLNANDLINPKSTLSGEKPIMKKTKNWFLPLDKMQPQIEAYIDSHKEWKSNVFGQCKSWLNSGLQPRAMTRDLDWGVKVPVDGANGKVLYVWFDAPIGYISATKELFEKLNNIEKWHLYWRDRDAKLVHFIGKDNIVFHCIIFPAMLMAYNEGLSEEEKFVLADNVPANEFLNLEGDKISTSRNWAVWLHEYLLEFPNRQDELRYVLTSIAPETKDSDFFWKYDGTPKTTSSFQAKVNNELVTIFGNFVNRVIVLTHKYFEGKIPEGANNKPEDFKLFEDIRSKRFIIEELLNNYHFREAQAELLNVLRIGNKYLTATEPWITIKTDEARVKSILHYSLQFCASLSILSEPFLPFTAKKLRECLNLKAEFFKWDYIGHQNILTVGDTIGEIGYLFKPITDEEMDLQLQKLENSKKMNEEINSKEISQNSKEVKSEITYDEFSKMDIRVGTILEAEKVPKADKLLKLLIDTGIDKRTVVSGIAAHFKPEDIIGQQVSILINLAPRKIKGIESQGMILMAESNSGELSFVAPVKPNINNGGEIR